MYIFIRYIHPKFQMFLSTTFVYIFYNYYAYSNACSLDSNTGNGKMEKNIADMKDTINKAMQ